jgi:hypothetical protein
MKTIGINKLAPKKINKYLPPNKIIDEKIGNNNSPTT